MADPPGGIARGFPQPDSPPAGLHAPGHPPGAAAPRPRWTLDPERSVLWITVRRLDLPWVQAEFPRVQGTLELDPSEPLGGSCEGTLDMRLLRAGAPRLNTELRLADVFDYEHRPVVAFRGEIVERLGARSYQAHVTTAIGEMSLQLPMRVDYHGWRRTPPAPDAASPVPSTRVVLRASTRLSRDQLGVIVTREPGNAAPGEAEVLLVIEAILDAGEAPFARLAAMAESDDDLFGAEHVRVYRETGGQRGYDWRGTKILLLTTEGRASHEQRTTPLIHRTDGERWVIVASKGGSPQHPSWYENLLANPDAEVQVRGEVIPVRASTAEGEERSRLWSLMTEVWPAYDEYRTRTDREIPVVVLTRR